MNFILSHPQLYLINPSCHGIIVGSPVGIMAGGACSSMVPKATCRISVGRSGVESQNLESNF